MSRNRSKNSAEDFDAESSIFDRLFTFKGGILYDSFLVWVPSGWKYGPSDAYDLGLTHPFTVPPHMFVDKDYVITLQQLVEVCRDYPEHAGGILGEIWDPDDERSVSQTFIRGEIKRMTVLP